MGADILTPHYPNYTDHLLSPNQSQYRINLTSAHRHQNQSQFLNYMNKDFTFTQETLAVLAREQIVDNNFSEEFDPLFTTFKPQNKNIYGKFRILCSNITNEKIQQYKMFFRNEKEFRTYLVSYFWRKNHPELKNWPLVRTTNLRVYEQSKIMLQGGISSLIRSKCSASKEIYCRIYVEDIRLRLCHIKDIPYPENLYVMSQILKGFQLIYENIGYIKPFEDLICITRKGQIKVWINSDLSKNFPNIEHIDQNITLAKSESKLVNQILEIVVNNTDSSGEPISFHAFLRQKHVNLQFISFDKALQMISKYEIQYNVQIPDVFNSIVEVMNQEEEEYDTYRTDMQNANQEKGQSSQPFRSQNRSGSGLFLDVPNNSLRLKLNNKHHKSRLSSKKQSSQRVEQKSKAQKTQSLKIGQHERNSLQQSMSGVKSNIILSQSLPISRSMNQRQSSNYMNGSRGSNKQVLRIGNSRTQIQKNNDGNLFKIERERERIKDSVILMGHNSQNLPPDQSNLNPSALSSQMPNKSQLSLKNFSKKYLNQALQQRSDLQVEIRSNKKLSLNSNRHPSQFINNEKTYSNLNLDVNYSDRILANEEEIEPFEKDNIVIRVEATEKEMQQMIEIDRFIEAEVLREQEEKLRLSEMSRLREQLLNKSQQLMENGNNIVDMNQDQEKSPLSKSQELLVPKPSHKQIEQKQTTILIPQNLKKQPSCQNLSRNQELSIPQMLTSRQNYSQNNLGLQNQIHSSHHTARVDNRIRNDNFLYIHAVQRPLLPSRPDQSFDSGVTKVAQLNGLITISNRQRLQRAATSHSKNYSNSNPIQQLSFQHSNIQIEIQPPSSSLRANPNSLNTITNPYENEKVSQKNLPHNVFSTFSNQLFVPISQRQLLVRSGNRQQQYFPRLVSSTSIANSIAKPTVKQVHFESKVNTIVSPASQRQAYHVPKITFTTKSPQKIQNVNAGSSKHVSIDQIKYSQIQLIQNFSHLRALPWELSNPDFDSRNQNVNRLSQCAQTMVSAYMYSQGENKSSRKYYDRDDSFSQSKPSIVEYSYQKNPEFFGNCYQGASNVENLNSRIPQKFMESQLVKIPLFHPEFTSDQLKPPINQQNVFKNQINHHDLYNSGPYEPHLVEIIPIPEQSQAEMFNNSRSLVNNQDCNGYKSISNSLSKNYDKGNKEQVDQIVIISQRQERQKSLNHQRQPSVVNLLENIKEQKSHDFQQENQKNRKQSYFVSEQFSHGPQDQIRLQQGKKNPQFKINISPPFESMSGCSQRDNQLFSNKSYITHSSKQNTNSFLSGYEKQKEHGLIIGQRASYQGSKNNQQPKSGYRVVQSIDQNRPYSAYQMDIQAFEKDVQLLLNIEHGTSIKVKGHNLDKKQNQNYPTLNQPKYQQLNPKYEKESHSPADFQEASPVGPSLFHKPPVAGRMMSMNNQNDLLSEFIGQESELQSELDYLYTSYDKWKENSKLTDFGRSRFKKFDQKIEKKQETIKKSDHVGTGYPERHGNYKQLVKSGFQRKKLLTQESNRIENLNAVQKKPGCNEAHEADDQNENQQFLDIFSPQNSIQIKRLRASSEYKGDAIDEEILKDLREY